MHGTATGRRPAPVHPRAPSPRCPQTMPCFTCGLWQMSPPLSVVPVWMALARCARLCQACAACGCRGVLGHCPPRPALEIVYKPSRGHLLGVQPAISCSATTFKNESELTLLFQNVGLALHQHHTQVCARDLRATCGDWTVPPGPW